MTSQHNPQVVALSFAERCGFSQPEVAQVVGDLWTPGTVAVWVKDARSRATLGVLLNVCQRVLIEFNTHEFPLGELPQGGLRKLLIAD